MFLKDVKKIGKFVLSCGNSNKQNYGVRSKYLVNDSKNMNGLRLKMTFTFSAIGKVAPIFITISGLNDDELPKAK